jgi:hypothetical protein
MTRKRSFDVTNAYMHLGVRIVTTSASAVNLAHAPRRKSETDGRSRLVIPSGATQPNTRSILMRCARCI